VNAANTERYTRIGVRVLTTNLAPWSETGAELLMERAAPEAEKAVRG